MQNDFGSPYQTLRTSGSYKDEIEACAAFDQIAEQSDLFHIHKEVTGILIQPPAYKIYKGRLRLDRLLIPRRELVDSGWSVGAIGVEIKRSDEKIGRFISQMLDYMHVA